MPISLPDNILELKNEGFLNVVQQQCGKTMVEIFRYLEINSADYLLNTSTENLFAFFRHNSSNIAAIKSKVGIVLNDGNFVVKNGLFFQADTFIRALHVHRQQKDSLLSKDLTISSAHLNEHPVLRQIIRLFEHSYSEPNSLLDTFIYKIIDTITSNYFRAKNHYSYNDCIREFACCVYILGGHNVYEFIRINIQGFLLSTTVIQREIDSKTTRMVEGEFRYDSMADHLASLETRFVFASEDCTAVVPKIVFDTKTNHFVGFTSSLEDGLPKVGSFSTESFSQLENWFDASNKSHYLNLQMIQPITKDEIHGSPFILSSYGTDNHFTTNDILMKWMNIFNNCKEKNTKLVGVSTDCDCRYMRSMRLFSGFFAEMPNQQIHMREDAFHLYIPKNWNWFFMRSRQLMLFFQDSIHLATKLRNRMLSSKATMLLGDEIISIDHLLQLIESSSKINHNLVRSDILPKDRQNYHSCEKISSKSVLDELVSIPNSAGTRLYLELIQNIRFAFVVKETNYLDRIYYAWKSVFLIRYWYSWLGSSSKNDLDAKLSKFSSEQNHQKKKTKQQFFITLPSMFSIEINCHTLVYLGLLVIQQQLPPECLNVSMFSSQNCENTFRLCRAMSGPFSSIVNFDMHQFLQRVQKISYLNTIKSRNQTNNSTIDFLFLHHHKLSKTIDTQQAASSSNSKQSLSLVTIEQNILRAYSDVSRLVVDVNIHSADQVFPLEKLSALAYQQLSKSRIIDYSCPDNYDSDFESDSDESCSDNDEDINLNETSQEEFFDDDQDISSENLMNIHTSTFEGMRVFDSIHPSLEKSYFVININGTKRYLNKQTATWLLAKEKVKLSADRLKRVMTVDE